MAYGQKDPAAAELADIDLGGLIAAEIRAAKTYDDSELSAKRTRALEYLRGEMTDTPSRANGSSVTSRDLADTISWVLPGIMRVFMASDRMAEYEPVAPDTTDLQAIQRAEENAQQASDYISYVFMKDNPGYSVVFDTSFDALLGGNGIIKHWWDDTPECETSFHSRLTQDQVAALTADDGVEILAAEQNPEPDLIQDPATGQAMPVETWNVKIKRETSRGKLRIEALAPEQFLIDEDATAVSEARFCAHHDPYMTRSRLIQMGFSKDVVDGLSGDMPVLTDTDEAAARRTSTSFGSSQTIRSMERIDYYECYIKVDVDGDGVAETVKVDYAGSAGGGEVLDWQVWEDDLPFSDIRCYPQPHRFDAESIADRTVDIQQIKTVLQRQALDNLYASNLPMREIEEGTVVNPDILVSPKFGGIVWRKKGTMGTSPTVPYVIPFVADKVFAATEYFDRVLEKRTGVSRTMMALDPEALQNQTATASQNARDAAYSQVELVARNMAEYGGWRNVFRALLRLVVKHQDRPKIIRLRGKFVQMDPRHWNANMDVTVNTGLGSGSRDRDMAMLQMVFQSQVLVTERLAAVGFHAEALAMLPKIRLTLIKIAESAGIRNPDAFYPELDDKRLQQMMQKAEQMAGQPPLEIQIEQMRAETQKQIEQNKAQVQAEITKLVESMKAEGNRIKEAAQLEGDLQKAAADRETQVALAGIDAQVKREDMVVSATLKREEIASRERIAGAQHALDGQRVELDKSEREPVVTSNQGFADAVKALQETVAALGKAHTAPRKIVRDPKTNQVVGSEIVVQ